MNREHEYELLKAFAKSKNYEFDGFKLRWLEQHPEPVEAVTEEPVAVEPEPESVQSNMEEQETCQK